MVLPNFLGVGGMKCATTWLAECLREHPEVFLSTQKEVEFFSRCWARGRQWYEPHFSGAGSARAIGEFSVSYLQHPHAAERIRELLGPIKIIVSLRDPADRFISHYKHYIRNGKLSLKEYSHLDVATLHRSIRAQPELFEVGRDADGLERYLRLFGAERVHVIFKDQIDVAPGDVLQSLYRFLGVDPSFRPRLLRSRVSRGIVPRVPALERVRIASYRWAERRAPKLIVVSRRLLLGELYRRLNGRKKFPTVHPLVRSELYLLYRSDIAHVESVLGTKLHWR
jgi:hypothetical protein